MILPPSTADLPPVPPEVSGIKLGGLWKDPVEIAEEEIQEARVEMWQKFAEE